MWCLPGCLPQISSRVTTQPLALVGYGPRVSRAAGSRDTARRNGAGDCGGGSNRPRRGDGERPREHTAIASGTEEVETCASRLQVLGDAVCEARHFDVRSAEDRSLDRRYCSVPIGPEENRDLVGRTRPSRLRPAAAAVLVEATRRTSTGTAIPRMHGWYAYSISLFCSRHSRGARASE